MSMFRQAADAIIRAVYRGREPRASYGGVPLVSTDVTYSMLDEASRVAGGADWLANAFATKVGGAVLPYRYPILLRSVSLISGLVAQLVTSGSLSVIDLKTGRRVPWRSGSRSGRALDLLTGSPDGMEPAYAWAEALVSDLLTCSNAIIRVERTPSGLPESLVRQSVSDAWVEMSSDGYSRIYRTRDWRDPVGMYRVLHDWDVAHSYWGVLQPYSSGYAGSWMATPVLTLLRSTLEVGAAGERYVKEYFESGATSAPFVVGYASGIADETHQTLVRRLRERQHRTPLILGDDPKVTKLMDEPQTSSTKDLREFQIDEVARVYGLPAPLVGRSVSSWGSVVAELGRFAWRFGVRQHCDRFLAGLAKSLLPMGYAFVVDPIDIVRGDPAALHGYLQAAMGGPNSAGWMTREEVRRWAGLPRDMDGELVPYSPQQAPEGREGSDGEAP